MAVRFVDDKAPKGRVTFVDDEDNISPVKKTISKTAHIALPVSGGAIGGILSAPLTPVGQAAGGALGAAGGVAAANLLDRFMGIKAPVKGAREAVKETASNIQEGALAELGGRAVIGAPKAAFNFVKKNLPPVSQGLTGAGKRRFMDILKHPRNILPEFMGGPKALETAGQEYAEAATKSFGEGAKLSPKEVNDPLMSAARKNAVSAANFIEKVKAMPEAVRQKLFMKPEVGALIVKGRKGTQFQLNSPAIKGEQRALLAQQEEGMNAILEQYFPQFREASKEYAKSATRADVMKVLPVLKSGDPSVLRGLMLLGGGAGGYFTGEKDNKLESALMGAAIMSPAAHAIGAAGLGASLKAAGRAASFPGMKQVAQAVGFGVKDERYEVQPLTKKSSGADIMKSVGEALDRRIQNGKRQTVRR